MKRNTVVGLIAALTITVGSGAAVGGYFLGHGSDDTRVATQIEHQVEEQTTQVAKAETVTTCAFDKTQTASTAKATELKATADGKAAAEKAAAEKAAAEKVAAEKAAVEKAAEKAAAEKAAAEKAAAEKAATEKAATEKAAAEKAAAEKAATEKAAAEKAAAEKAAAEKAAAEKAAAEKAAAEKAAAEKAAAEKAAAEKAAAENAAAEQAAAEKAATEQAAAEKTAAEQAAAEKAAAEQAEAERNAAAQADAEQVMAGTLAEKAVSESAELAREAAEERNHTLVSGFESVVETLKPGQGWAVVELGTQKALLVTEKGCSDNGVGNPVAGKVTVYGLDHEGNVKAYGKLEGDVSQGIFPIKAADGCLMAGNDTAMKFVSLDQEAGSMIPEKAASVFTTADGTTHYSYMNRADGFEGEVETNGQMTEMVNQFKNAEEIIFSICC